MSIVDEGRERETKWCIFYRPAAFSALTKALFVSIRSTICSTFSIRTSQRSPERTPPSEDTASLKPVHMLPAWLFWCVCNVTWQKDRVCAYQWNCSGAEQTDHVLALSWSICNLSGFWKSLTYLFNDTETTGQLQIDVAAFFFFRRHASIH